MSSWVRYCIAVYFGLLFSGALARPPWTQQSRAQPPVETAPIAVDPYRPGTTVLTGPATEPCDCPEEQ